MRVRYCDRNGEDADALFGQQKTLVSMMRRRVVIAETGHDAGAKIIALLTPFVASAAAARTALEMDVLMELTECIPATTRALHRDRRVLHARQAVHLLQLLRHGRARVL